MSVINAKQRFLERRKSESLRDKEKKLEEMKVIREDTLLFINEQMDVLDVIIHEFTIFESRLLSLEAEIKLLYETENLK